jgi:hypothetical protein
MKELNTLTLPEPALGTVVHATPSFSVRVDTITDAETKEPLVVYGIINNRTGVREAELRGEVHAVQWANKMQAAVNEQVETEAQEAMLKEAMPPELTDEQYAEEQAAIDAVVEAPDRSAKELNDLLNGL